LLDFSDNSFADLSHVPPEQGCVGWNVDLEPGSYLLRLAYPGPDVLERTIVASEGWQTQVFLEPVPPKTDDMKRPLDFENAAVLMSPMEVGFLPSKEEHAWVEIARQDLAAGRSVVPERKIRDFLREARSIREAHADAATLRQALRNAFPNPMLILYAAHLLMLRKDPDCLLLREMADCLRDLLGNHPDVQAIYLWLDPGKDVPPVALPPMLRSSWAVLVERGQQREQLFAPASYALRVCDRLWGAGAGMIWRKPELVGALSMSVTPKPAERPQGRWDRVRSWVGLGRRTRAPATDLLAVFRWAQATVGKPGAAELIRNQAEALKLSGLERRVFAYLIHLAEEQKFIEGLPGRMGGLAKFVWPWLGLPRFERSFPYAAAQAALAGSLARDQLARSLGVPLAALTGPVANLESKFQAQSQNVLPTAVSRASAWRLIGDGLFRFGRGLGKALPRLTLVEVGTVAAILVTLAGLLLPAARRARDAANRMADANNLKMIGLAIHSYSDAYLAFPLGTADKARQLPVEERLSWMASILPYMEVTTPQLNPDEAWNSENNRSWTRMQIKTFLNPAITLPSQENITCYVGMAGVGVEAPLLNARLPNGPDAQTGIFGYNRVTKIADVGRDGTSNTIMVIGVDQNLGPWAEGGPATVRAFTAQPYIGGPDGFGSGSAGANACFADGSVRFLSKNLSPQVLQALATIGGDKPLDW
jgi:prepilin-type processing-associated H-X9-DG protein